VLIKLHHLFTGVVLVATILTVVLYLWALNSTTIYERAQEPKPTSQP
jgi:hypothetical protein